MLQSYNSPQMSVAGKLCDGSRRQMSLAWSFGDHNARVQEGARNATLVDQNGAWHLRSTNHCRRAVGRSYSLEAAIHSVIHRGYYQIQRYTQAGMGNYNLTSFEFKRDDRAV
jgi:hypothetical protein